jgi:ribonuclease HI
METECWFDGSITKNPGGIAYGSCVIKQDGKIVHTNVRCFGQGSDMSVNVAEIGGGILAMEWLKQNNITGFVKIYGDSKTAVLVLNHDRVNCKKDKYLYYPFYKQGMALKRELSCQVIFVWIPREQNTEADSLMRKNSY